MDWSIDVAGTGFTVLDRIYADDDEPFEALGGSCGNVLLSLAMLERAVAPILVLGEDAVGNNLVEEFRRAGADTRFIFQRDDLASPVVIQKLDTFSGQHSFSFISQEAEVELPSYEPIAHSQVAAADRLLASCSFFYADRLSEAILSAMETAAKAGAVIYFEPSAIDSGDLFDRALYLASVVKFSSERIGHEISKRSLRQGAISIVTHGSAGLEVRKASTSIWCKAAEAPQVRDTCGSGDMVSIGLIDWMLSKRHDFDGEWPLDALVPGIIAGQRLAALNCGYLGARGIFQQRGAAFVREILDSSTDQLELFAD